MQLSEERKCSVHNSVAFDNVDFAISQLKVTCSIGLFSWAFTGLTNHRLGAARLPRRQAGRSTSASLLTAQQVRELQTSLFRTI